MTTIFREIRSYIGGNNIIHYSKIYRNDVLIAKLLPHSSEEVYKSFINTLKGIKYNSDKYPSTIRGLVVFTNGKWLMHYEDWDSGSTYWKIYFPCPKYEEFE